MTAQERLDELFNKLSEFDIERFKSILSNYLEIRFLWEMEKRVAWDISTRDVQLEYKMKWISELYNQFNLLLKDVVK